MNTAARILAALALTIACDPVDPDAPGSTGDDPSTGTGTGTGTGYSTSGDGSTGADASGEAGSDTGSACSASCAYYGGVEGCDAGHLCMPSPATGKLTCVAPSCTEAGPCTALVCGEAVPGTCIVVAGGPWLCFPD
jgi:hypothetical protein